MINYGIMPMNYERPPATAGSYRPPSSGHGPNSHNMSRSQAFGSKSKMRQKEATMTRTSGKSQPTYQRHQVGQQVQSQPFAEAPTMHAQATKVAQSPPHMMSAQHVHSYKAYNKYGRPIAIKPQNKLKSRHDKLQGQVQSHTQSKKQLRSRNSLHGWDPGSQGSGVSDEFASANKVSLECHQDANYNHNVYFNVANASAGKPLKNRRGRLVQAFDQFDATANAAPPARHYCSRPHLP